MYDSIVDDFGRVSDYSNNGLTPLQGQQDEQLEAVDGAENAIEHDVIDILTEYPPWSTETYDSNDYDEDIMIAKRYMTQMIMMKTFMIEIEKRYMTQMIMMMIFMIEIEKRYKMNYLKIYLLKLKIISHI